MATNTTATTQNHNGTGSQNNFAISFAFLANTEVDVKVGGVLKTLGTHYNIVGSQVQFTSGNTPPSGTANIVFTRDTDISAKKVDFADGSVLTETDLDNNSDQILFAQQEFTNDFVKRDGSNSVTGNLVFEGATDDDNETTLAITNPTADRTITIPDVTGSVVTTGDTGTVSHTMLANDAVDGDNIADDSINSEHYVGLSIDTEHIANENVTTAKLQNNAVSHSKLGDNAVDSRNYVDGSIDHEHLANNIIDGDNIQDDAVDTEHIANGAVDTAQLKANSVNADKIADDVINSEHYVAGSIDHEHLATDIIDGDNIQDDVIDSEHIVAGALDNEHYANNSITSDKLTGTTVITSSEQASATTNDTSFLTSAAADARFFNISTGDTIKDGQTFPDNDTTIATTAAINDRIIDLIDDVGGFTIIASEQAFPDVNPQGVTGQAAVLSIKAATTNLVPSGTTVTITNGNVADNANITITGVTSTIPSGFGFLVESTSTTHTYTFHRLVPKATEVTTVAGKAVEIGRLGTADAVADMAILGTTDVVADMAILATNDVVADMNTLATADIVSDMNTLAVADVISDMDTVATNVTNVNNVGNNVTNVNSVSNSAGANQTFTVTVQNVSGNKYFIDGVQTPVLKLARGKTYTFDMSDSSNSSHPLAFRDSSDNSYTTGVTTSGTAGSSGATVVIVVAANAPSSLKYYCTSHGNAMGNTINVIDDNVGIVAGSITNVNTVGGAISNVNSVGGSISNVNTVASNLSSVNSFANTYRIGANNPTDSLDVGDLFFNTTSDSLKVYTGSAWVDGVTQTGDFALKTGNTFTGSNIHNDNVKAIFGTSSDGLEIFHNASDSIINDQGTGSLKLQTGGNTKIEITSTGTSVTGNIVVSGNVDGRDVAADGSKLDGIASGATAFANIVEDTTPQLGGNLDTNTRNIQFGDSAASSNDRLTFGDGTDLSIYHNGTDNYIDTVANKLYIRVDNSDNALVANTNGAVELYHSGSKKFDTIAEGVRVHGDEGGTAQLQLLADEGDDNPDYWRFVAETDGTLNIQDFATGSYLNNIRLNSGAAGVELYYNNSKKFETTSGGGTLTGRLVTDGINLSDSETILLGNNNDFSIFHDPSLGNVLQAGFCNLVIKDTAGQTGAIFKNSGAVELNHNGSKKFETTASGVTVTGNITGSALIATSYISVGDDDTINAGGANDLKIYHQSSDNNSYIENDTGNLIIRSDAANKDITLQAADILAFNTGGANERMRIDSSGNVAIGTTSAAQKLHIDGASNDPFVMLQRSGAGDSAVDVGGIQMKNSTNILADIRCRSDDINDGMLKFSTMGGGTLSERMRIDSSGHVGIGVTPANSFSFGKALDIGSSTGAFVYVRDTDASDAVGGIGYSGSLLYVANEKGDGSISFRTNTSATERMRINSSGQVGIGTSSPTDKFHVVGTTNLAGNSYLTNAYVSGSIFLGGTGSANQIDDYEEGSFDIVAGSGSSVTFNSSNNKGSYTKIGRQVTIAGQLRINSGTGNVRIALPFNSAPNTNDVDMAFASSVIGYDYNAQNGSDCDGLFILIDADISYARFLEHRDNNPWTSLDGDAGAYLQFTITYFVP